MLVDIPTNEVANFNNVLKSELPESSFVTKFLETSHKWKQLNNQLDISLLYTARSMETGVFIGIVKSGINGSLILIYALDGYENDLEEALKHVRINWKNVVLFEGIAIKHAPIINRLISEKGLKIKDKGEVYYFSMSKEKALNLTIECPDDVELAPIQEKSLGEIYEMWILKEFYTIDHLKNCFNYNENCSLGVFSKSTGDLLTRCLTSHCGLVTALQTVENARRKGYAKLLLKYYAKTLAEMDLLPCGGVQELNSSSQSAFNGAGFENIARMKLYWMDKQE